MERMPLDIEPLDETEVLMLLGRGVKTYNQLAESAFRAMPKDVELLPQEDVGAFLYYHLRELKKKGVIKEEKTGTETGYRLTTKGMAARAMLLRAALPAHTRIQ